MFQAAFQPGDLLRRWASDWRVGLTGLSAGLLQLMHPGLGAGVAEHSAFFTDPWGRIVRSVPQIWATILDEDADAKARAIRDLHRTIKGVDTQGRSYHALDPGTFWWAHATFTWGIFGAAHRFAGHRFDAAERERVYADSVAWYARYGLSQRPVPPDYDAFRARFDEICASELELTPAAARAVDLALHKDVLRLPKVLDQISGATIAPLARLTAIGGLPPIVRQRFDIPWTAADRAQYRALVVASRQAGRLVPRPINAWTFRTALAQVPAA